ncbi:MAG: DHCW motif cupin fold protein [Flammeovirgaceae bacterium]|nr:DHCW motif cupin fold protein [Flammeovirgaceae bacterium]
MKMIAIPYQTIDWDKVKVTEHPGEQGTAYWRTISHGALRVRMVEYSPGYKADHWCEKGHIIFCVRGELTSELADGTTQVLRQNMGYHVSDGLSQHRSSTREGAVLFIVDGEFLSS